MEKTKEITLVKHVHFFEKGKSAPANGSTVQVLCGKKVRHVPYRIDVSLGRSGIGVVSPWSEEGMCASCLGKWRGGNFDHRIDWMVVGSQEEVPAHSHEYRDIADNLGSFHDRGSYWTQYVCVRCDVIFIVGAPSMAFQ